MSVDRKSFFIDLNRLYEAKRRNNKDIEDCLITTKSAECKDLNQCLKINEELDREIQKLMALKRKYNLKEILEPDDMYMLDPTKEECKSNHVKYHPRMFNIDLGVPTCNTVGCNTTSDDIFRINPNVRDNWEAHEEQFMLQPRTNQLIAKWELDQKQKLRIYPHMFTDYVQLQKESEKPFHGGISGGGVDYPIPMRFQLRYLQQPQSKRSQNIDYDVHIKRKDNNLPEFHDFIVDKDFTLRDREVQRCNRQRGVVDRKLDESSYSKISKNESNIERLEQMYDRMHAGDVRYRDELRKAARSVGYQDIDAKVFEHLQCERSKKHQKEMLDQPLYDQRFKGIPQYGETITTRGSGSENFGLQTSGNISIKRQTAPSQLAQGPSGFFKLGPPLPPPNPELLSAVDPSLLVHYTDYAKPNDERHLDVKIQMPSSSNNNSCGPLLTDRDQTLNPLQMKDSKDTQLFQSQGGGIEGFKNVSLDDEGELQFLPEYANGEKPNLKNLLISKDEALQRIKYQIAHLNRLEPILRQKQIQHKETNHTIEINKSTLYMDRIQNMRKRLELLLQNIGEEREDIIKEMKTTYSPQEVQGILKESEDFLKKSNTKSQHFFHKMSQGVGLFYTETDFNGEEHELAYGFHDFPEVGGLGNNKLASFKIPKDTILTLYEYPERGGIAVTYRGPRRIRRLPSRFHKKISGIDLKAVKPPYEAECYTGKYFQGNRVPLKIGFYDYPNIGGVGNKKLESFKLPEQLIMTVYSRPNKQGEKITYIGPFELPFFTPGWVGQVSGIEIQIKNQYKFENQDKTN